MGIPRPGDPARMPRRIGFTCGAMDLCHAGHVLMLAECKEVCDYLIVGLHTDPSIDRPEKNKPVMSVEERRIILEGIKYVDEIVEYDTEADLYEFLKQNQNRIDVRILGSDWCGKAYTGHDLSIDVYFNGRDHGYSTTELRRRILEAEMPHNMRPSYTLASGSRS